MERGNMRTTHTHTFGKALIRRISMLLVMVFVMSFLLVPGAMAITGDVIAADNTYSFSGPNNHTFKVVVENGKIKSITGSYDKTKYQTVTETWIKKVIGADASYNAIDAFSAATSKTKYDLKTFMLSAMKSWPQASGQDVTTYDVTFSYNGHGYTDTIQEVAEGSTVTKPDNPSATGYVFNGWFTDSALTKAYDFSTAVTKDFTLYAKWTESSTSTDPDEILLTGYYYNDTVKVEGYDYYVTVSMTVYDGKIVNVTANAIGQSKKNAKRLKAAIEGIRNQLIGQAATISTVNSIDSVSGATYSSNTIRESLLIAIANGRRHNSSATGSDTFNRKAQEGTYINSSATTFEEVYNPIVTVKVDSNNLITEITADAPGIRPFSAARLAEVIAYLNDPNTGIVGKDATQATVAAVDVDSVSGATHSMKAVTEEIYAAFAGQPISSFTKSEDTGYTIYNPPAEVSDNGLTLKKSLTRESDGTYTVRLVGYATKSGPTLDYYLKSSKETFTKSDLDSGNYYYDYDGKTYQVKCGSYKNTDYNNATYYYAYFIKDGVTMYMHQKGANTVMEDSDGYLNLGSTSTSEVYKAGEVSLYEKTDQWDSDGDKTVTTDNYSQDGKEYKYKNVAGKGKYYYYNSDDGKYYVVDGATYTSGSGKNKTTYYLLSVIINGTEKYIKKDGSLTTTMSDAVKKDSNDSKLKYDIYLYTKSSTSSTVHVYGYYSGEDGLEVGTQAVLVDEINLNAFDITSASYTASIYNAKAENGDDPTTTLVSNLKTNESLPYKEETVEGINVHESIIEVTGFNYTSNYVASGHDGQALVLTISGLKLAEGAAGRYISSNIGNAEIYVDAQDQYPEVAAVSPLFDVITGDQHTVTYNLDGGKPEEDYPAQKDIYPGQKVYIVEDSPQKDETEFLGWEMPNSAGAIKTDYNGTKYFIMPDENVELKAKWNSLVKVYSLSVKNIVYDLQTKTATGTKEERIEDGGDVYLRVDYTMSIDNVEYTGIQSTKDPNYKMSFVVEDESIATEMSPGDYWLVLQGKAGKTKVTMLIKDRATEETVVSKDFYVTVKQPLGEGLYGDYGTVKAQGASYINYYPIMILSVDKDGIITDVTVDADTATAKNWNYLNAAITYVTSVLKGKDADQSTVDEISEKLPEEVDGISKATVSVTALKQIASRALQNKVEDYTVEWTDTAGNKLGAAESVAYGTRTATILPKTPTKDNYVFDGWVNWDEENWSYDDEKTGDFFVIKDRTKEAGNAYEAEFKGQFTLVYSSDPKNPVTLDIRNDDNDYSVDGYDVTEKVGEDGYLYGGIYADEDFTKPVTGTPGTSFIPSAGTTYYIKEVSTDYLQTKNIRLLDSSGNIVATYAISVVDSNQYISAGFLVNGEEVQSINNAVYSSVAFKNVNESSPYTAEYLLRKNPNVPRTDITIPDDAGVIVSKVSSDGFTGSLQAYWITPDGVLVTGTQVRNVENGNKTKTNGDEAKTSENKSVDSANYENPMKTEGSFVDSGEDTTQEESYVRLAGYTTSLNGTIEMNFYMEMSEDIAADPDAYMQFELPGSNTTADKIMLTDARKVTRDGKTYYVFSAGVAAKNMVDDIKATFNYHLNGEAKTTETYQYTIQSYCEYIIDETNGYDAESIALAKSMLNYGAWAQKYDAEKNNTTVADSALANANLSEADKTLEDVNLDDSYKSSSNGSCTGLKLAGSAVMTTTTTSIRHFFTVTDDIGNYEFVANGKSLTPVQFGSYYYVDITGIKAKDMDTPIVLAVTNTEDSTQFTVNYSVYTNIKSVVEGEYTAIETGLMKSVYYYSEAAKAYFASR